MKKFTWRLLRNRKELGECEARGRRKFAAVADKSALAIAENNSTRCFNEIRVEEKKIGLVTTTT